MFISIDLKDEYVLIHKYLNHNVEKDQMIIRRTQKLNVLYQQYQYTIQHLAKCMTYFS